MVTQPGHLAQRKALRTAGGCKSMTFGMDQEIRCLSRIALGPRISVFIEPKISIRSGALLRTLKSNIQHSRGGGGEVYLKLTVIDDVLIVSFKEL